MEYSGNNRYVTSLKQYLEMIKGDQEKIKNQKNETIKELKQTGLKGKDRKKNQAEVNKAIHDLMFEYDADVESSMATMLNNINILSDKYHVTNVVGMTMPRKHHGGYFASVAFAFLNTIKHQVLNVAYAMAADKNELTTFVAKTKEAARLLDEWKSKHKTVERKRPEKFKYKDSEELWDWHHAHQFPPLSAGAA
jgi:hypothetical protein